LSVCLNDDGKLSTTVIVIIIQTHRQLVGQLISNCQRSVTKHSCRRFAQLGLLILSWCPCLNTARPLLWPFSGLPG